MLKVDISHSMLVSAAARGVRMGRLKHSFMSGERNLVGALGEEIYSSVVPDAELVDNYDYDFLCRGLRVDVKTRIVSSEPRPEWEFAIHFARNSQDVDFYIFCAVSECFRVGWLIGYIHRDGLLKSGVRYKKGDEMPQGGRYKSDCHIVYIKDLLRLPI